MAVASGVVDTDAILADERVVDMQDKYRLLNPDEEQFFVLLGKLPSQPAVREKINWLEDQFYPNLSSLAASATSAATTLSVATGEGDFFRAGDQVRLANSGEIVEVSSISTDDLTVVRSVGSIAANTAQTGVELLIIGNAVAQGADYGTLKVQVRTTNYNYTQIQRHPFGFTNTMAEIETYGAGDPENEAAKKLVEHKRALANTSWLGGRDYNASTSKGNMGGIVSEFLTSNVSNAVGALSLTAIETWSQGFLRHGTMNKVLFASPIASAALSKLMNDDWVQAPPDTKFYGAHVNAYVSGAFGSRIPVIVEKSWGRETTAGKGRGGWLVALDIAYIKKRPLRNRGTRLLRNRQGNGIDSVVHEYLTEMSLEVAVEKAHGLMTGITGSA